MALLRLGDTMRGRPLTAREAREAVRSLLRQYTGPLTATAEQDCVIVASELVSNALAHAGGVTAFIAALLDGHLEITVCDAVSAGPDQTDVRAGLGGGHGWKVVNAACGIVTVTRPRTGGKRIRGHIALTTGATPL
ncbi:ATP-binding protein [Streptomyces sp. NPDC001941]|uniref:ATP-binding protein n=1 Tax=Streptomyces sp. NPDC001941 TaxID=3154659 RepID=UPI00332151FA